MQDLDKLYPESFYAKRAWLKGRSRDIVRVSIELFDPKDTIDLGCGAGDLTKEFLAKDIDAYGLEGTDNFRRELLCPQGRAFVADLRKPINTLLTDTGDQIKPRKYDLLTCLEVGEHIETERIEQFIKNLAIFSDRWLMSINPNPGKYHYTVKPFHWWAGKIESIANVRYREDVTYEFRKRLDWLNRASNIRMILDNLLYFEVPNATDLRPQKS